MAHDNMVILADALREIDQFSGGTFEYETWIEKHSASLHASLLKMRRDIERVMAILPVPAFTALCLLHVAQMRLARELWLHQNEIAENTLLTMSSDEKTH